MTENKLGAVLGKRREGRGDWMTEFELSVPELVQMNAKYKWINYLEGGIFGRKVESREWG